VRPSRWPEIAASVREAMRAARGRWSTDREGAVAAISRRVRLRLRAFLGLEASG
jgi:hypothetical protein